MESFRLCMIGIPHLSYLIPDNCHPRQIEVRKPHSPAGVALSHGIISQEDTSKRVHSSFPSLLPRYDMYSKPHKSINHKVNHPNHPPTRSNLQKPQSIYIYKTLATHSTDSALSKVIMSQTPHSAIKTFPLPPSIIK